MKRAKIFSFLVVFLLCPLCLNAQTSGDATRRQKVSTVNNSSFDISTNLFDWADLMTINFEAGMSLNRNFSLHLGGKFNPWEFHPKSGPYRLVQNKHWMVSFGGRYWPWYVFSGWWIGAKVQYCDFDETGLWRPAHNTGKALGAGLSAGYTLILTKNFNVEFGAGFWGGKLLEYTLDGPDNYSRGTGSKPFLAVNDLNVSLHWVF